LIPHLPISEFDVAFVSCCHPLLLFFDVILSEGGLPRAVFSAGDPSRRIPFDTTTLP
jgi:hypothetical protein